MRALERIGVLLGWVFVAAACFIALSPGGVVRLRIEDALETRRIRKVVTQNWVELADSEFLLGNEKAEAAFVEFLDYTCFYCRSLHDSIQTFLDQNPDRSVAIRFRILRSPKEAAARSVITAAVCAGSQGRFEAAHQYFFTDTTWLRTEDWGRFLSSTAVPDANEWRRCFSSNTPRLAIARDSAWVAQLAIGGTPTLVGVDGTVHTGVIPLDDLPMAR